MRGVMLSMLKKILPYLATLGTAFAIPTPPPVDYAQDVRPILAENCFYCHGQDATKRKAKLRLDTREGQLSHEVIIPHPPPFFRDFRSNAVEPRLTGQMIFHS